MPTNNFKLFDENKANMMTDQEYNIAQQRLNGVQSGVASSQLQNKTLYQTALMCYALAQLMAANGYDANDADAVSTFVNNLNASMVQKVVDKASSADLDAKTIGKWVDAAQLGALKESVSNDYLKLLGGTMLGDLILHSDPTQPLQAATKKYVDGRAMKIVKSLEINFASSDESANVEFDISEAEMENASMIFIDIVSEITLGISRDNMGMTIDLNGSPFINNIANKSNIASGEFNYFLVLFNSKNPISFISCNNRNSLPTFKPYSNQANLNFDEIRKISYGKAGNYRDEVSNAGTITITIVK